MDLAKKIGLRIAVIMVFLIAANQVYRAFFLEHDLQEHSDLINLVREIPDSARVVYFGESSNFTFGDYDLNTKRISDLISGYFPDLTFGTVSHGALHAGNYKTLLKNIPEDNSIETIIVTLNLRSFNAQWIDSKLETSLAKSMVMLQDLPPLLKRALLSFKAYDIKTDEERENRVSRQWKRDKVGSDLTVNEWTEKILSRPDSLMPKQERLLGMHYIRTYAFEIDEDNNPRINDFDEIVDLAGSRGWNLVLNLMAENTEKAEVLTGPELVRIMRENALSLASRYSEMGAIVVNNLESVPDPSYLDRNWTTEHYDEKGRKIVAGNVAGALKKIYPGEYREVIYRDTLKRSEFFNDCEGSVRWFQMGTCSRENSYSGEYSSKINREDPFSIGFTKPTEMIPEDKLNTVSIDFQYLQPYQGSKAQIVMELLGGESKAVWRNYHISDSNPPAGEWFNVNFSFNIPEDVKTHKLIKLYVWNPGKEPVFVDDIRIQFR